MQRQAKASALHLVHSLLCTPRCLHADAFFPTHSSASLSRASAQSHPALVSQEITESMAVWNALRRHILPKLEPAAALLPPPSASPAHVEPTPMDSSSLRHDTIIVVGDDTPKISSPQLRGHAPLALLALIVRVCAGDGSRPRTAALCAMLSKWKCVSVDPVRLALNPPSLRLSTRCRRI
jgi:hypothetical protein